MKEPSLLSCITRPLQGWIDLAIYTEEVQTADGAKEEAEMGKAGVLLGPLESVAKSWDSVSVGVQLGTSLKFYSLHNAG